MEFTGFWDSRFATPRNDKFRGIDRLGALSLPANPGEWDRAWSALRVPCRRVLAGLGRVECDQYAAWLAHHLGRLHDILLLAQFRHQPAGELAGRCPCA